jgi:hypothetical protein
MGQQLPTARRCTAKPLVCGDEAVQVVLKWEMDRETASIKIAFRKVSI